MGNYENIRRYSEHMHEMAQAGGVDAYLAQHAKDNFDLGVLAEKKTEGLKFLIGGGMLLGVWEGGKYIYRRLKTCYDTQKERALKSSDAAEAAIKRCIEETGVSQTVTTQQKE